jgi:uncharacterized protein
MSGALTDPLDDSELDELHELLLSRFEDSELLLDAVHGLLAAVAIGPDAVAPSEWIPLVIEDDKPFEDTEQAERMLRLLLRLYNGVVRDLDRLVFEPILGQIENEDGEPTLTARGWCEGFALGVDLRGEQWEARMQSDPRLLAELGPIIRLAEDEGVFASDDGEDAPPLSEAEYEDAMNQIGRAVLDVQSYWREHPIGEEEIPPEQPAAPTSRRIPRWRGGRSLH